VSGRGSVRVLAIVAPHEVLLKRLTGRRTCATCGEIYNVYYTPPRREGICDRDGGPLFRREDDNVETVTERLLTYHERTAPLFGYYRESGRLFEVDGERGVDEVFDDLSAALERE
jgi:adenylate kinase